MMFDDVYFSGAVYTRDIIDIAQGAMHLCDDVIVQIPGIPRATGWVALAAVLLSELLAEVSRHFKLL